MSENDIQWLLDLVRDWLLNDPLETELKFHTLEQLTKVSSDFRGALPEIRIRCSNELTKVN